MVTEKEVKPIIILLLGLGAIVGVSLLCLGISIILAIYISPLFFIPVGIVGVVGVLLTIVSLIEITKEVKSKLTKR